MESSLSTSRHRIEQAIRKLWSANEHIREFGRKEVLQIGSSAAGSLVNLLTDLINHPDPRFVTEGEEEGQRALKNYIDLFHRDKEIAYNCADSLTVNRLSINSRLIVDAISLLGDLRAAEGIPILIHIMENHDTYCSGVFGSELEALSNIGSPALGSLYSVIEKARIKAVKAHFRRPIIFGFVISLSREEDDDDHTDDPEELESIYNNIPLDAEDKFEIERIAFRIKQKAIMVIGKIGDKQALSFLEPLIESETDKNLIPSILAAIREIKHESPPGFGPVVSTTPRIRKP